MPFLRDLLAFHARLPALLALSLCFFAHGQGVAQTATPPIAIENEVPRTGPAVANPLSLKDLKTRLFAQLTDQRFDAAEWGVKVVSLENRVTLFEFNPQKLLSPASNSKLYTIALALDRLGTNSHIRTSVYAPEKPDAQGTIHGNLTVYGRGDPCINARLNNNNIFAALQPIVAALTNAGLKRVSGDIVGDESFIKGPPFGSGWAWDDMEASYGAEISALTINDNTVQLKVVGPVGAGIAANFLSAFPPTSLIRFQNRVQVVAHGEKATIQFFRPLEQNVIQVSGNIPSRGPDFTDDVPVHHPAEFFVDWLREALKRSGVTVEGKTRTRDWQDELAEPMDYSKQIEVASMESLPMSVLAREVMKPSQNLYTDLLLAQAGEKSRSSADGTATSERLGLRELRKFLAQAGVKTRDVLFDEGSGLSRNNITTARATCDLLLYMHKHPAATAYLDALPIAGVDGTLRKRMKNTAAAGNVRAKTGTLRWANSLSGYVTSAAGEHLAFSAMLNRYETRDQGGSARAELDSIAVGLASLAERSH